MAAKVLTLPVADPAWRPPGWKPPPGSAQYPPRVLGDCPECDAIVWGLSGSPRRRPHLVACVPCGHWVTVDEANDIENGAWTS